ncbi:hypothetical protein AZI85_08550 [Bdellovibrio bacteriovorus]|uniref:Bdellovibrio beta-sandwich domain-containing protein n=1 Tax=Bdellovibrio bacteriovorus TaxID=959 RepID=A0A150WDM2_BDEBC|nr:hypothetical protein [Bdellovibrio bacteriovorus]KYG61001.1 hypothetical protein AZI85_08550 [Bdellovibrio bacteriovorus]
MLSRILFIFFLASGAKAQYVSLSTDKTTYQPEEKMVVVAYQKSALPSGQELTVELSSNSVEMRAIRIGSKLFAGTVNAPSVASNYIVKAFVYSQDIALANAVRSEIGAMLNKILQAQLLLRSETSPDKIILLEDSINELRSLIVAKESELKQSRTLLEEVSLNISVLASNVKPSATPKFSDPIDVSFDNGTGQYQVGDSATISALIHPDIISPSNTYSYDLYTDLDGIAVPNSKDSEFIFNVPISSSMLTLGNHQLRLKIVGMAMDKEELFSTIIGDALSYKTELTQMIDNSSGASKVFYEMELGELQLIIDVIFDIYNSNKVILYEESVLITVS